MKEKFSRLRGRGWVRLVTVFGSAMAKGGKVLPLRLGFTNLLLTAVQLIFMGTLGVTGELNASPGELFLVIYSLVTVNLLAQLVTLLAWGRRWLQVVLSLLLFFLYVCFYSYHLHSKTSFDYAILKDNFTVMFNLDALRIIVHGIGPWHLLAAAVAVGVLFFVEVRYGVVSARYHSPPYLPKVAVAGLAYILVIVAPLDTLDDFTRFFKSAYHYHRDSFAAVAGVERKAGTVVPSPVVRGTPPEGSTATVTPDIFLVLIESFSGKLVGGHTPEGAPYTPYFDSITSRGVVVEHFYGNSIQTSKGQFATLFSVVPSIRGKVFVHYPRNRFYSLPAVLRDHGYLTIFFQAYRDLSFDNTQSFLSANGFSIVKSVAEFVKKGDEKYTWGWGLQDDLFYERFFEYLDGILASAGNNEKRKPIFAVIAPISNHAPFDRVPRDQRILYKNPRDQRQHFANSIRLADSYLERFFEELQRRESLQGSMVIITADHSYPAGEHGFFSNEVCFYEEFFRIPFLLIWEGKVAPERIRGIPYSQLDIAPTIIDLLNLPVTRHHFQGVSIFEKERKTRPIYLVQPYGGKYLCVVVYPYKYVYHVSLAREFLFDLVHDPMEKKNLIRNKELKPVVERMRKELKFIYHNQQLIQSNGLWPGK